MKQNDTSIEHTSGEVNLERLIAVTYDQMNTEKDTRQEFWEKADQSAYEEIARFRDAINEGHRRTYSKMTLHEKIAASRRLLGEKQRETEALQKLCADLQYKLNKFRQLANE